MADDEDFSKLPLASRWRHTKWKARQSAYDEVAAKISKGQIADLPSQDDLRSACADSNVIALESGIKVSTAVLGALTESQTAKAVSIRQGIAPALAEKGLVAAKPAVKQAALEALLTLVCVADPAGVVGDILPFLSAKSPKAVTASTQALDAIFREFGSPVTDPKPVLKALPDLFAHTDRNVRVAATQLATSLCRWVGEATVVSVLGSIKPVQLTELKQNFAKIDFTSRPPRLTQKQQAQLDLAEANRANNLSGNAANGDRIADNGDAIGSEAKSEPAKADPWDFADPQNVLSKVPDQFYAQVNSAKWKERLEVLTAVATMLSKAIRLDPSGDYQKLVTELIRIASKDTNQMCATQAIVSLGYLASGLRKAFAKYGGRTVEGVVERFKERKQSVLEIVVKCLDDVFFRVMESQFAPMLEIVWPVGVQHKTPLVRLESVKYCTHLLCESTVAPKVADIDMMSKGCLNLLADTQEAMRAAASSLLAACIKVVGEQRLAPILKSLDDHKRKRVDEALKVISVKCQVPSRVSPAPGQAAPGQAKLAGSARVNRVPGQASGVHPGAPPAGRSPLPPSGRGPQPQSVARSQSPSHSESQLRSHAPGQPMHVPALAAPHAPRSGASGVRSNLSHSTSPVSRRNMSDMDMSMSLTSPSHIDSQPRDSRPSISSTPKIVKRSFQRADFTPAREEAHRRRIYSPAKGANDLEAMPEVLGSESNENSLREIARLSAQLNLEKSLRSEIEKQLARVQVEKDQEIIRLREEMSALKVQLQAQKEELRVWIQNEHRRNTSSSSGDDIGTRLSILSIGSDIGNSSRPASAVGEAARIDTQRQAGPNMFGANSVRPPPRHLPNRVVPISLTSHTSNSSSTKDTSSSQPQRTGSDDWERAVSMTHSLKQRVEQLKQQKERTF